MSTVIELGSVTLLPIKEAADFVPYSRDYVARLAREGKIVATYLDRQWFVDVTSLQNFYSQATIEESVRKQLLSSQRKRDLEVAEMYRSRLADIARKHARAHRAAVLHTMTVVCCGLAAGLVLIFTNERITPESMQSVAAVFGFHNEAAVVQTGLGTRDIMAVPPQESFDTGVSVTATTEPLDISRGVVLLPSAKTSTSTVTDFFSDPVVVLNVSSTTGTIRNTLTGETMPFVRIPDETGVVPPSRSNDVVP